MDYQSQRLVESAISGALDLPAGLVSDLINVRLRQPSSTLTDARCEDRGVVLNFHLMHTRDYLCTH